MRQTRFHNSLIATKERFQRYDPKRIEAEADAITKDGIRAIYAIGTSPAGSVAQQYLEKEIKHWDKILHLAAPDDAARIAIAQTGVAVLTSFLAFLRTPLPPADEPVETEETN